MTVSDPDQLLDATARAMNLRIKRVEAPSRILHQRFRAGEFDLLQDYSEAPDRVGFARGVAVREEVLREAVRVAVRPRAGE